MLGKTALLDLLVEENIPHEVQEHAPVLNMQQSGTLELTLQGSRCKNLLLQDKRGDTWLVVTTASKSMDLLALAATIGSKRLSFASSERLWDMLGLRPGSLSPLALINDPQHKVRLLMDLDLDLGPEQTLLFHPLDNGATVALSREGLERFLASTGHRLEWVAIAARTAT